MAPWPTSFRTSNLPGCRPKGTGSPSRSILARSTFGYSILTRRIRTRLTFGPVTNSYPVWAPDSKWIAYCSDRNGRHHLYRKPSDGSGAEELLLDDDQFIFPNDWSGDGKFLFYSRGPFFGKGEEIWALPLDGDRKPFLVVPNGRDSFASGGRLSPDGRWLAYSSDESGQAEVYIIPFRGGQGKW